ncbi:MAG: 2-phospho-L-lactate guanylyltransferase [Cyanobacteria bacterium]|jgi:predicted RNase H-like HicB family nuclease|nr:2-phospho-L-lactate guanylyltransferase [Cyanobacteria bacterium GSL.Bin1]
MNSVIVFEVSQEEDGGFVAECLTEDIFTQGESWEELRVNVNEAVKGYYFDQPSCPKVKLHLFKEEMLVIQ